MGTERAIAALEQALSAHQAWAARLHRRLIAGMVPTDDDLSPDAHHRCTFGRWYDAEAADPQLGLAGQPAFAGIGTVHAQMHDHARQVLCSPPSDARLAAYDRFAAASDQLASEVRVLQQGLLTRLLSTDPLTGLPGRRNMEERLALEWQQSQRDGQPAVIAMMDLDHFKRVNDSHGHAVGDQVLEHVAAVLREQVRLHDVVARMGGEEFVVLLPQADIDHVRGLASRLCEHLRLRPLRTGAECVVVTASIGLAVVGPADADVDGVLRRADDALYRAKSAGRDQVQEAGA